MRKKISIIKYFALGFSDDFLGASDLSEEFSWDVFSIEWFEEDVLERVLSFAEFSGGFVPFDWVGEGAGEGDGDWEVLALKKEFENNLGI